MRRQRLTGHGAERFRNYGAVLQQHEQHQRLRKVLRVFSMFAVILILITLLVIVFRAERKIKNTPKQDNKTAALKRTAPILASK